MARVSNVPEQKTNLAKPKGEPTSENSEPPAAPAPDIEAVQKKLQKSCQNPKHGAKSSGAGQKNGNRGYEVLCLAADQFLARRRVKEDQRTTIIAGFPWFADWGRDVFVSLPGLLLLTGKTGEAKSVLTAFAQAADEGMIPNRFDDYGDTAYFNSIDASLWFIDASFRYLAATGDSAAFTQQLLPTIRWVVERYQKGTRFGIHADTDGLITGGDGSTQLTWMDAKCDGIAFTARGGKAVEVNALWYSSLRYLTQFYYDRDTETAKEYGNMAGKVAESFRCLFWNEQLGYLNDAVLSDGSVDATLRPNQIFAVSLPFSALSLEQQRSVVNEVEEKLLTPYGLRTLSPEDSRYRGQFTGPQRQRDEAYHQGTVWPYLMGPFVEAYLKVNEFSKKSKKRAAELIEPLLKHLTDDGCLGQISEIFDGDPPHRPRGCFAQAWSVAELIRAYRLIHG
jgi:predicted glycogen debranching enzyme